MEINLVEAILSVKEECFDEKGTGPFINRVNGDIPTVAAGLETLVDLITQLSYYIGIFIATFIINKWVFLCELILVVGLAVIERIRSRNLQADKKAIYKPEEEKSSLIVDIITGERNCSSGYVLLDDVNIANLDKSTLRGNMMVVSQSPHMFNTSIKENLLLP